MPPLSHTSQMIASKRRQRTLNGISAEPRRTDYGTRHVPTNECECPDAHASCVVFRDPCIRNARVAHRECSAAEEACDGIQRKRGSEILTQHRWDLEDDKRR